MRRIAIILFCVLLLGLVWARSTVMPDRTSGIVRLVSLNVEEVPAPGKDMQILAAWHLQSDDSHFGGYSSLALLDNSRFLTLSDRGRQLHFSDPSTGPADAQMGYFAGGKDKDKFDLDAESLTRDPASGTIWIGYENSNSILRVRRDGASAARRPPEMQHWPDNSGPEAMARVDDGRFIVLSETQGGLTGNGGEGLLFPDDPVSGDPPVRFTFRAPDGYRPTDMAQLPDGRVLILLRKVTLALPPQFSSALMLADPHAIKANRAWQGEMVARFESPALAENYEGLAIAPASPNGRKVTLWMISDDNTAVFQRTLLLKLRWTPPARDATKKPRTDAKKGAPAGGAP